VPISVLILGFNITKYGRKFKVFLTGIKERDWERGAELIKRRFIMINVYNNIL